jgi:hypothetical protein
MRSTAPKRHGALAKRPVFSETNALLREVRSLNEPGRWREGSMGRVLRASRLWLAAALLLAPLAAGAAEPIRIGFGMALTGGLAGNGKAALVAMEI